MRNVLFALKSLRSQPVFFATAVLTLALGIGFNTLMFSAVHGVLLRPLPFPQADSLVSLWTENHKMGVDHLRTTPADFFDWRDQATTLTNLGGYTSSELNVFFKENALHLPGATVTVGFFDTLGVQPLIGRLFEEKDFKNGAEAVVVLTEGFWRREFGGERTALDRTIKVAGKPYRIVGIVPDAARLDTRAAVWVPMAIAPSQASRRARFLKVIGRKQPTMTLQGVEAEMALIAERLAAAYHETNEQLGIRVVPLRTALLRDNPEKLMTMWGAVAIVLLMICANIILLLLANTDRRKGELAVRFALGASHRQIAEQLLTETILVALSGGLFGFVVAALSLRLVQRLVPDPMLLEQLHLSGLSVLFALGLSLIVGLVIGCIAILRMPGHDLRSALIGSGRGQAKASAHYLQKALVTAEVAITVVLLVATGLMLQSLQQLWVVDPGYDVERISAVSVVFPGTYPPGSEEMGNYVRHAIESLEALPGIERAASGVLAPLEGVVRRSVQAEGVAFADLDKTQVTLQAVSSSYFETMGVEIKAGRVFTRHERRGVALANEALAHLLFSEEAAIGRRLKLDSPLSREPYQLELVGVVESERLATLTEEPAPALYIPHDLELLPMAALYVRQANHPTANLDRSMQKALQDLDSEVAVNVPRSMATILRESLNEESTVALLLGGSGGIALILSLLGVYGVWALFVSQRQREFGIRLSLGARPERLLREVLYRNLKLTIVGLGAGVLLSLSMVHLIRHWLFKVQGSDPGTLLSIVVLVAAASVVAGFVPAWKASRVDVMRILRDG